MDQSTDEHDSADKRESADAHGAANEREAADEHGAADERDAVDAHSFPDIGAGIFTDRRIGILLTIGSVFALLASFQLSLDKVRLLEDPDYNPACNFSILMSCQSVMTSEQGSVFGFPNPFIGLIGFGILLAIGVAAASGVRFPRWYWVGTLLGLTFAVGFIHWLAYQSIFSIQVLCPWCMVVWAATIPMFWYGLLHVAAKLTRARWVRVLQSWHLVPVVVWFLAVAAVNLVWFWDFYWADFFANL